MTAQAFALALREHRRRLGLRQPELAALLGVSRHCVSKWERSLGNPMDIAVEGALARLAAMPDKSETENSSK